MIANDRMHDEKKQAFLFRKLTAIDASTTALHREIFVLLICSNECAHIAKRRELVLAWCLAKFSDGFRWLALFPRRCIIEALTALRAPNFCAVHSTLVIAERVNSRQLMIGNHWSKDIVHRSKSGRILSSV